MVDSKLEIPVSQFVHKMALQFQILYVFGVQLSNKTSSKWEETGSGKSKKVASEFQLHITQLLD